MCNSRMANPNFEWISAAFAFSVSSYNPNFCNIIFFGSFFFLSYLSTLGSSAWVRSLEGELVGGAPPEQPQGDQHRLQLRPLRLLQRGQDVQDHHQHPQARGRPFGPHLGIGDGEREKRCHQGSRAKSNLLDANTLRKGGGSGGRDIGGGLKNSLSPRPCRCWYVPLGTLRRVCSLLVLDRRSLLQGISCSAVARTLGEYGAGRCGHTRACNRLSNGGEECQCLSSPAPQPILVFDNDKNKQ